MVIEISSRLTCALSGTVYVPLPASFNDLKPGNHFSKRHHFLPGCSPPLLEIVTAYFLGCLLGFLEPFERASSFGTTSASLLFWPVMMSFSFPLASFSSLPRVESMFGRSISEVLCFGVLSCAEFPEQSLLSWIIPVPAVAATREPVAIGRCCDRDRLEYDRGSLKIVRPAIRQLLDNVSCEREKKKKNKYVHVERG